MCTFVFRNTDLYSTISLVGGRIVVMKFLLLITTLSIASFASLAKPDETFYSEKFCEEIVKGNLTLKDTSHTIINQYYEIDVDSNKAKGEIYVLALWGSDGFNYTCSGRYLEYI